MNKKEYLGKWWIPKHPSQKLFGKIYIDLSNKIELEILDRFNIDTPEILLGITDKGEYITLDDIHLSQYVISLSEYTRYEATTIIFHRHFKDYNSIKIKTFNI